MATNENDSGASAPDVKPSFGKRLRTSLASPKPIGFYLFLLIAVTIIPAIAIAAVLLHRNDLAQREVVQTLAAAMADSITEAVDRELNGMVTTLRVLSTTPSLAEGNIEDFYSRARAALAGTGSYLTLLDQDLDQLIDTRVPYDTPLGRLPNSEFAQEALDSGSSVISGTFYSETSQQWAFYVAMPYLPDNEEPRVLVLMRDAASMGDALSQPMLRGGWNATLVDRDGTVIASSFLSTSTGKPFFLDVTEGASRQRARVTEEMNEESYIAITDVSNYSGWDVVVWAPAAVVEEPTRRSLRFLFGGSLVVIAIGSLAAWYLGRQIAGPVRRLAQDAHRLGAGETVEATSYPVAEATTVSAALADAALDRKAAENEIRLLMREVAHRAKNQLTVVASMAKQTARHAQSLPSFLDSFQKRLYGLARSTDLLIAGGASGVELRELLLVQIEPFKPDEPSRLELSGPPFRLDSQAAQTVGLAIHELATNAAKYGAFASRKGQLVISWRIEDKMLVIVWREYLPILRHLPGENGFGNRIIERMMGGTLEARISRTFHRDGLECIFRIPAHRVLPSGAQNVASE